MIKLALNTRKFNNYAFFCPVSRLHLTVSNPVGYTNEVTPVILRALKANTILDVDKVIDIDAGTVKAVNPDNQNPVSKQEETKEPVKESVESLSEESSDNTETNPEETETSTEEKPKKGGRKPVKE